MGNGIGEPDKHSKRPAIFYAYVSKSFPNASLLSTGRQQSYFQNRATAQAEAETSHGRNDRAGGNVTDAGRCAADVEAD